MGFLSALDYGGLMTEPVRRDETYKLSSLNGYGYGSGFGAIYSLIGYGAVLFFYLTSYWGKVVLSFVVISALGCELGTCLI